MMILVVPLCTCLCVNIYQVYSAKSMFLSDSKKTKEIGIELAKKKLIKINPFCKTRSVINTKKL